MRHARQLRSDRPLLKLIERRAGGAFYWGILLGCLACTSISVQPLELSPRPTHVCIEENPKVIVSDFVSVLEDGIRRNGMTSELFSGARPEHCRLILTYTALRSWDFAPYLSKAELWLNQDGKQVAYADYHLIGKGGYSFLKWQSTKTKMDPVIDQLLGGE